MHIQEPLQSINTKKKEEMGVVAPFCIEEDIQDKEHEAQCQTSVFYSPFFLEKDVDKKGKNVLKEDEEPPEALPSVFTPFFNLEKDTDHKAKEKISVLTSSFCSEEGMDHRDKEEIKEQKEICQAPAPVFIPSYNSTPTINLNVALKAHGAPPLSQYLALVSPLTIKAIQNTTTTEFTHNSTLFGQIDVNIELCGVHSMHYNITALHFITQHLQSSLPLLLQNLQKSLPKLLHHTHSVSLKKQQQKKKLIAQFP